MLSLKYFTASFNHLDQTESEREIKEKEKEKPGWQSKTLMEESSQPWENICTYHVNGSRAHNKKRGINNSPYLLKN